MGVGVIFVVVVVAAVWVSVGFMVVDTWEWS